MASSPGELVDTHCHLVLLEERGALDDALALSMAAGVAQLVSVGLNLEDSDRNREIAEATPGVYFSVGWHPHEPSPPDAAQLAALHELTGHPRAVAVGEIGLDRYWRPGYHEVPLDVQERSLQAMLELAETAGKPVIIHDRDAHDEVLAAVGRRRSLQGVMHCFSGDADHARRCRELGYVVSFSGSITFPRSEAVQEAARVVGDDGYVVETDSPFLAPVPHRGRTNIPAYVAATAAALARIRGLPEATVRKDTSRTARRLFGLPEDECLGTH